VARLLGATSGAKVSRYENFARTPSARTVFAYEILFNRPASELFAGVYEDVRSEVQSRANRLIEQLRKHAPDIQATQIAHRLQLLQSIVDSKLSSANAILHE
jgi:transcriptional regulator with XRE-family HTH domain